jgi:hypothetical protein
MRTRLGTVVTALGLSLGLSLGAAVTAPEVFTPDAEAKARKPAKKKKPAPKKPEEKIAPPNAAQKKALGELMGAFTFQMDKDAVIAALAKQVDERYAEQITATSDVYTQDKLRKEKQKEITRIKQSFVSFEGKKTGWDVSLIDQEFKHNTQESMLMYWENAGGKNQRRFFFFYEGKLWKMFVAIDTKALAEDQRNFTFFRNLMESRYGKGKVEGSREKWDAGDFEVHAVDKMAFYGAFGLLIQDPKMLGAIAATREANAPAGKGKDAIIEVIRDDGKGVNLDENSDAVDAIINGSKKP